VSGNEVNSKVLTGWDKLIQDAEQKIEAAKERIDALRKAAKDLKRIRDSGQPWPKAQARGQSARQQHSD
jgi:hypothetical protein